MPTTLHTPQSLLQRAAAFDAQGQERRAIPLYRQALKSGLPNADLHAALIGLGSSLRTLGQTQAAIRILQKTRRTFPNDPAITLFLALAHADQRQYDLAIRQLADTLLKESRNPRLAPYRQTLRKKYHALRHTKR